MITPVVSICCVTYNHIHFLKECLDGFLMQKTSFPIEILIHDDASTDGTTELIKTYEIKYPELIKPVYQKENQFSKGKKITAILINKAKGKYIALCEGDDYWTDPLKLEKQVNFLEGNEEYVMTYHDVSIINENGALLKEFKTPAVYKRDFSSLEIMKCEIFVCTMSLVFRNVIKTFPKEFLKVKNGDSFLTSLLGQYGKGKYFENIGGGYRVHVGGLWSSSNNKQKAESKKSTFFQLHKYYKSINNHEISDYYLLKSKSIKYQESKGSFISFIKKFMKLFYKKFKGF